MVAAPDVVDAALAANEKLVDVGSRLADVGVGRAGVAFLVAAQSHAAATRATDVAGGERHVH